MNSSPLRSSYDFVSIGGGSAGYAAARVAQAAGLRTAVIEGGQEVGGLCILRGCMPSKTLIESANRYQTILRAREFGLRAEQTAVVPAEILERKRRLVGEFADYRRAQLQKGDFDFIRGRARFADPHRLEILDLVDGQPQESIDARTVLVATGSVAACPFVPGLREAGYLVSDDVLELATLPASAVVLGAGAIGLEAAHHLSGLGVAVTVIQRSDQVLREADADVAQALTEAFRHRGVPVLTGTTLEEVTVDPDGGKRVRFRQGGKTREVTAREIICALGREPSTDGLELGRAGVELTGRGAVKVGPDQRSVSCPHVFAAGDVCSPHQIVHLAIQQGEVAARNAVRLLGREVPGAGRAVEETDYRLLLFALFTQPQAAWVGRTEQELRAAGRPYRTASYAFADHGKALVRAETEGFVKLIVAADDGGRGEILGAAVVGPEAAELIHEITVAMHFRATAADLSRIPHYHPTLSEIWTYPAEELAAPTPAA